MEVILKENIKNLGKAGEVVKVSDGYARNFLLPRGKVTKVTKGNIEFIQEQAKRKYFKMSEEEKTINETLKKLSGLEITIKKLAGEDDKLFGSVSEADIAEEIIKQGIEIDKKFIALEKHIKELGLFNVPVVFRENLETRIKLWVVRENEKKG